MKRNVLLLVVFLTTVFCMHAMPWKASWIEAQNCEEKVNTWQVFKKGVQLAAVPKELKARIAVDSKYWMWVNGKMVVFEGELKRGPAPGDTYYDEVDIAPYLKKGENTIALLTCYFGKEGFSYKCSGKAGLLFDAQGEGISVLSDATWEADVYEAYGAVTQNGANYRLPESCLCFDGNNDLGEWYKENYPGCFPAAKVIEKEAVNATFGKLVKRPVPMFVFTPLKKYVKATFDVQKRKLRCQLPYDAQVTPYLKVKAKAGLVIDMRTDCFDKSGVNSIRAEYITRQGVQEYESLGWMNGNWVEYTIPEGVEVIDVKYRESGYDTQIAGTFECNDPFWNELWKRSARTLYVNMRDTYFDCPDRERAQWWGDIVNDIHENFYVLTPTSWQLVNKGMYELINWQRPSGVIYSPVPAGNWEKELPCQMLMSVGKYGFYSQYYYTGDNSFVAPLYGGIHRYLHDVWSADAQGFVPSRTEAKKPDVIWSWADWGTNIDLNLITNEWYYMALDAEKLFADMLDKTDDAVSIQKQMDLMKQNFDARYWTGSCYRSADYKGEDDDRAQALAVLCGFVPKERYEAVMNVFRKNHYASPLLEMYVQEAMFKMGYGKEALERAKKQYSNMMSFKDETTVFEFWEYKGKGGTNHAWASSMTVIMGRDVCGIRPTQPAFKTFEVAPQMAGLEWVKTSLETRYGTIAVELKQKGEALQVKIQVPAETETDVKWNGKTKHLKAGKYKFVL